MGIAQSLPPTCNCAAPVLPVTHGIGAYWSKLWKSLGFAQHLPAKGLPRDRPVQARSVGVARRPLPQMYETPTNWSSPIFSKLTPSTQTVEISHDTSPFF